MLSGKEGSNKRCYQIALWEMEDPVFLALDSAEGLKVMSTSAASMSLSHLFPQNGWKCNTKSLMYPFKTQRWSLSPLSDWLTGLLRQWLTRENIFFTIKVCLTLDEVCSEKISPTESWEFFLIYLFISYFFYLSNIWKHWSKGHLHFSLWLFDKHQMWDF